LNPIKRKTIVEKTAADLDLPVQIVDEIVSFYYKTVQKKLSAVKHHSIVVPNLGTFVIKRKALEEKIKKSILFVQKIETDIDISVQTYELIIQKRKDIADYLQLLELMKSEQNRKQEVKLKKQEFKDGKSN
jgi:nucleoid DNA-binding protein